MYHARVTFDDAAPGALQAMADPHRWRLLRELAVSDRRVGELTRLTGDSQNLVSYHLRSLRDAGLVTSRRSSFDGRDSYYRVDLDRCARALCAAGAALDPGVALAAAPPRDVRRARPRVRVLFLCTGNSARSQMAEALLVHHTRGAIDARSAGSAPKPLHPEAVRVLAARGIDISARRPKHVDRVAHLRFDHVITLCDKVREVCPDLPGGPAAAHWSVPDPAAGGPDAFEDVLVDIDGRVRHLIARLAQPKLPTNQKAGLHHA